ncbi:hypothetical protein V6N11_047775 [Hibiscus sabdariffa]|uniref:RNase H type-1 domain-containing protein n=1 Tax=Hibiscus sabdariffa TaxID=183260 RepID=A0ABR2P7Y0_9ROSI
MDVNYVFRDDFLRCCERLAREYVAEFHKANLVGRSDALGGCSLVDSILLLLARSWSMCISHILRYQNLVADRVVALCRGSFIVSMTFASVPVALAELVCKEAVSS